MEISKELKEAHLAAISARNNSHSPYSKFKVGAAVVMDSNIICGGCNVENSSYGATICAERTAILSAVAKGGSLITELLVVTDEKKLVPPCAACLQVIAEFADTNTKIYLANLTEISESYSLLDLLPHPFSPAFANEILDSK